DDPLGRMAADPDDRVDRGAVGCEVEDALEQAAGVARPGGALAERHPLGHLDDAERSQLPGPRIEERGAEPDQLLRGGGVRDGNQDPGGERSAGAAHRRASAVSGSGAAPFVGPTACCQRSTRYGLSSSNSRAWRSTRSSAWSVVWWRFSMTKLPTRPK